MLLHHYHVCGCSRSSQSVDVPVSRNVSYITTTYRSTTRCPQPAITTGQSGTDAQATEYSRIGPSYEIIHLRRQPPVAGVSARLSERYEFSEAYLAEAGSDGGGGIQQQ